MKRNILLLMIVSLLWMVGACEGNSEEDTQTEDADNQTKQLRNESPQAQTDRLQTNQEVADHLASVATKDPDVHNAYSVIAGPYAVVGIDVGEDLDRSRVGSIKYSVSEALHNDPYGKTALVIADGDIAERLRVMGDKIEQGHPVSGIIDEVSAIVGRYMPEGPTDTNRPEESDQEKENMPDDEKQELNDIQEEQSNQ